jgi:hypothetical protein
MDKLYALSCNPELSNAQMGSWEKESGSLG